MARPRKSTRDEWIDTFADWDTDAQEAALDLAHCEHRQAKRRATRGKDEDSIEARAAQPAARAATGQQSPGGLPDEDQKL